MSRFYEGDGFDSQEDEREFYRDLAKAYKLASEDLRGFLAHLDAMPVKRIIADRFIAPRSGEACAVAEFCRFKGIERKELLKAEAESRLQRLEYESEEMDGWGGPTVGMGMKAGLPEYVAHSLAWNNDMVWTRVETTAKEPCICKTPPSPLQNHAPGCHFGIRIYRDMTPEERWLKLRNHVAKKIAAPILEQP